MELSLLKHINNEKKEAIAGKIICKPNRATIIFKSIHIQVHLTISFKICILFILVSLNIFILHRLRNKFLQLTLISLDSASWELHQYSRRMCGPMKNPKVRIKIKVSWL